MKACAFLSYGNVSLLVTNSRVAAVMWVNVRITC
jgi:hypothetical protein